MEENRTMEERNEEIYERIYSMIEDAQECADHCTSGSAEREKEIRNLKMLIDAREEMRQTDSEIKDREERRRIEEEKNENNKEIEMKKAKKGAKEYVNEYGQIVLKGAISLVGSLAILAVILNFEEHGSLHSSPGRGFKVMNPFQFKF